MADRRMFTKKVTDDDNFMSLSSSAQALYLHLSMSADDDGFCNQVSLSMFKAHASVSDLEALLDKRYVYQFDNGVIVIKHWRMANALRKDRYTPTAFQEELKKLGIKDNGSYTWLPDGCQMVAERLPQDSIGKDSIGKSSIGKYNNPPISPLTDLLSPMENWSDELKEAFSDWLEYKNEKRQAYKPTGLKSLVTQVCKAAAEYGDSNVAECIRNCMSSNYQGITFDRLAKTNKSKKEMDNFYSMTKEWADEMNQGGGGFDI